MMRAVLAASFAVLLASCAMEMRSPVTGKIGGDVAFGYSTARLQGESTFTVDTKSGLRCDGVYDASSGNRVIQAETKCNDGRTGIITIVRKEAGFGGTATGALSDGTKGQFVFGKDVRYEDEFPGPDQTANRPPKPLPAQKR